MRTSREPVYVYRGVHGAHPAVDAARRGIVFPGDINGSITPERHNLGGVSGKSPYTSWTYDYDEASGYATNYGGGGVILRATMGSPPEGAGWYWVESPDEFGEQEILLFGNRMDLEVIFGGPTHGDPETA